MKEAHFHTVGNPPTGISVENFGISEGNKMGGGTKHPQNTHLTITASGDKEVAQMLTSATSEWGLGREARVVSVFRVRTGPECPENNLRELM